MKRRCDEGRAGGVAATRRRSVAKTQYPWILSPRQIVVRTEGSPTAMVRAIREQVAAIDKDVPISEMSTMKEIVSGRSGRSKP